MRFVLNFIFFGILFYLIYLFLPETFNTLVSWLNKGYDYIHQWIMTHWGHEQTEEVQKAILAFFFRNVK